MKACGVKILPLQGVIMLIPIIMFSLECESEERLKS